jgi:hypothetical protein
VAARSFLAPDKINYLTLACNLVQLGNVPENQFRIWPAQIVFRAQTFFSGGGRVDSVGPSIYSFWMPRVGHDVLLQVAKASADPIEFFQSHVESADQFAQERVLAPVPHKRFDDLIRSQEGIFEEERQYFLDHPYSWVNHLRWYLQWPRKETRG